MVQNSPPSSSTPSTTSGQSQSGNKEGLDHAWRYFALHAGQRFSVFNFYVVLIGLTSAGLGVALQGSKRFALLGIVLGLFISLLSFVFWKLDQRGSSLIKHSEAVLRALETVTVGNDASVFELEHQSTQQNQKSWLPWRGWTFGQCMRLIFLAMGLFGLGSATLSSLKALGIVNWQNTAATPQPNIYVSNIMPPAGHELTSGPAFTVHSQKYKPPFPNMERVKIHNQRYCH